MFRPPSLFLLLSIALLLSGGMMAGAQTLDEMRADFNKELVATLEPVSRKYIAALRRLEKEFALARNYEAAIAVRDERLSVEALLGEEAASGGGETTAPTTGVPTVQNKVYVAANAAAIDGAAGDADAVKLSGVGQAAVWKIEGVEPGGYDVVVTYASGAKVTLQVMEHFFRLSGELAASGGETTFATASLGTLKITSRAEKLTLTAKTEAPVFIREIKLVSNRG